MQQKLGQLATRFSLIAFISAVLLSATGCNSECVDRYDCQSRGKDYMCDTGKCVPAPPADAGT
jgi:hypothetical protein